MSPRRTRHNCQIASGDISATASAASDGQPGDASAAAAMHMPARARRLYSRAARSAPSRTTSVRFANAAVARFVRELNRQQHTELQAARAERPPAAAADRADRAEDSSRSAAPARHEQRRRHFAEAARMQANRRRAVEPRQQPAQTDQRQSERAGLDDERQRSAPQRWRLSAKNGAVTSATRGGSRPSARTRLPPDQWSA